MLRIIKKILIYFLVTVIALILVAVLSLNFSFSRHYVTKKVNQILSASGIPVSLLSIKAITFTSFAVNGVSITGKEGDTIIYLKEAGAGFSPLEILKKRVILQYVRLDDLSIKLSRNNSAEQLNIAEAFSGGSTIKKVKKKKSAWEVSVRNVEISKLNFRMSDSVSGLFIYQKAAGIVAKTRKMSIIESVILLESLKIKSSEGTIDIKAGSVNTVEGGNSPWKFGISNLSLNDMALVFNDLQHKMNLNLTLGECIVSRNQTDLKTRSVDFNKISLSNTSVNLLTDKSESGKNIKSSGRALFPWKIRGTNFSLENFSFSMGDYSEAAGKTPANNFQINELNINVSEILLDSINAAADIRNGSFKLGNGFQLRKLSARLNAVPDKSKLSLAAETGLSSLNMEVTADCSYPSLISQPEKNQSASAIIKNTTVSLYDFMKFDSALSGSLVLKRLSHKPFRIALNADFKDSVLTITSADIVQAGSFDFRAEGKVRNIFNPNIAEGDVKFGISDIDTGWFRILLKDSGVRGYSGNLMNLTVAGRVTDSLVSPDFGIKILSNLGNIDLSGSIDLNRETFLLNSVFERIMAGKITSIPDLGSFSGSCNVSGSGFKNQTLTAKVELNLDSVGYKGYDYKGAFAECNIKPGEYEIRFRLKDPMAEVNMNSLVNKSDSLLRIIATGSWNANLKELNLIKDSLIAGGQLTASLILKPRSLESDVTLTDLNLRSPRDNARIAAMDFIYRSDTVQTSLDAEGDFFKGSVMIRLPQSKMKTLISGYKDYFSSFTGQNMNDTENRISYLSEMRTVFNLNYHKLFEILGTGLYFKNIQVSLLTNLISNRFDYQISAKEVRYKQVEFGSLNAGIIDSAGAVTLLVEADKCSVISVPFSRLQLSGRFKDRQGMSAFSLVDKNNDLMYNFEILARSDSNRIVLNIPSKKIILNRVPWIMDSDELLTYSFRSKTISPGLKMQSGNSYLLLTAITQDNKQLIHSELKKVKVSSFLPEEIIKGNPSGEISGMADYAIDGSAMNADFQFSDLSWSDLSFKNGSVKGNYISKNSGEYTLELNAGLDSSTVMLKADKPANGNRKITADISNIPVRTAQPFVKKILSDLNGSVSGNLNISTPGGEEEFTGQLSVKDVNLRINSLNSAFRIPSEKIVIKDNRVVLDKFRVLDSLNNELLVDGSLDFSNRKSITADLEISSNRLQVMNTAERLKSAFYGNIFIDSKISVKGPVSSPVLGGRILLANGTEVFFSQSENLSLSESEKVLRFVNRNVQGEKLGDLVQSPFNLYNKTSVEAIVDIDPATRINVNLSKRLYNLGIRIQGGGSLNYLMKGQNQVSLSGKFEVSNGTADMKMVGWPSKAFVIKKGGFVRWEGNLEDPELRFEALNRVRSSYTNPIDGKVRDVDFNVMLILSNRLTDLSVLFTINTPDQYLMSIINTLSPEEQMRQAITILLFEKIDLPGISTSSSYMSEQVNQILASQLNQITKTTIKGIDISFGIDSYTQATESGGQETKTSLSYEVKRALMNNRAQIELSGRINDVNKSPTSSDMSLNNFSFEYRLDSAATKFLKVYNEHTYEDVFEGEVVKTGVGLTYRKSYPTLGDIWKKEKKQKKTKNQD